uniref:Uncharacterized protein n=1 Tax=Thermofilum adornatum TaxID=1365176 RepID=A0A7C1GJI4_9CREN
MYYKGGNSIPKCNDHRELSRKVIEEEICGKYEEFVDLCNFIDSTRNILNEYICQPDEKPYSDRVYEVEEYCVCNGKEVEIETCNYYMERRRELENLLRNSALSTTEREKIKEELGNIPYCRKRSRSSHRKPVKHHGGVNETLWWYYVYTAAKDYMRGLKDYSMMRLARALHYAQDGPLSRKIFVEGELGIHEVDDVHDNLEYAISNTRERRLETLDIAPIVQRGMEKAVSENPFSYDKNYLGRTGTSVLSVLELMIEFTAYTLVKFIEIVRFVDRSKEKLLRHDKLRKTLMTAGIIEIIAVALASVYFAPLQAMLLWLTVVGASLIVIAQLIYEKIKAPLLLIKGDGEYEKFVQGLLAVKTRKGVKVVSRRYQPHL